MQRLVRPIGDKSIKPAQAIADNEDNPAKISPVVNGWLALRLLENGAMRVGRPEKVAHAIALPSEP